MLSEKPTKQEFIAEAERFASEEFSRAYTENIKKALAPGAVDTDSGLDYATLKAVLVITAEQYHSKRFDGVLENLRCFFSWQKTMYLYECDPDGTEGLIYTDEHGFVTQEDLELIQEQDRQFRQVLDLDDRANAINGRKIKQILGAWLHPNSSRFWRELTPFYQTDNVYSAPWIDFSDVPF